MNDLDNRPEVEQPRKPKHEVIRTPKSCPLHIVQQFTDDWEAWLSPSASDPLEGVVVGTGDTRDACAADTVAGFEELIAELQKPRATESTR